MPADVTAAKRTVEGLDELRALIGQEIAISNWLKVDQAMIDRFAATTGDHQWIHVDVDRALEESPFKRTIAHGYLVLSLAARFGFEVLAVEGVRHSLNYGLDRVRFPAPVPSGSRVRARIALAEVRDITSGTLAEFSYTFESDAGGKPVCVARALSLFVE